VNGDQLNSTNREVSSIVFDVNGVLTASPLVAILTVEERHGIPSGALLNILVGDYTVDSNHPWHRVERGEISFQRYLALVGAKMAIARLGVSPLELQTAMHAPEAKLADPAMIELLHRLDDNGVQLALLTNGLRRYRERWQSQLPMHLFKGRVVDSCVEGVRKPSAEIYRIAQARFGFDTSSTLFVDDYSANAQAAHVVGWQTLHHIDPAATIAQIAQLTGTDLTKPLIIKPTPVQAVSGQASKVDDIRTRVSELYRESSSSLRERVSSGERVSLRERASLRERVRAIIVGDLSTPLDPPLTPRRPTSPNVHRSAPRAGLDRVTQTVDLRFRSLSLAETARELVQQAGVRIADGLKQITYAVGHEQPTNQESPWQVIELPTRDLP